MIIADSATPEYPVRKSCTHLPAINSKMSMIGLTEIISDLRQSVIENLPHTLFVNAA